jgi:acetyl esterase/lipase
MATRAFAVLWTATPQRFQAAWDSAFTADQRALLAVRAEVPVAVWEREAMRLRFRHAWGRTMWPYFHWRETDAASVVPDTAVASLVRDLPLADTRWWDVPEHMQLVSALVHERGRSLLASNRALQRGDVRWLRAEMAAARELFADRALRRHVSTQLITAHLDENDERGIDSVYGAWKSLAPDSTDVARVDSMIAASTALRSGHLIESYKVVGGVPLELHLLRPLDGDTVGPRPAMLWFHGGSGNTGSWSHSPGVVRNLRANGVTVVAVEFRTGSRFDAGPVEPYNDAVAALAYVRRHAARLGLDAKRIGVAGFSSGAGLALSLGTRGINPVRPAPRAARRTYPAAVIATGTCVAPASPREDGYFRKMVRKIGDPKDYSPIDLVAAGQPPTLLLHGTNDEYCAYQDVEAFVARSRAAGNAITLSSVAGATHFFGFYHRPGQAQMRSAIADALTSWGWVR